MGEQIEQEAKAHRAAEEERARLQKEEEEYERDRLRVCVVPRTCRTSPSLLICSERDCSAARRGAGHAAAGRTAGQEVGRGPSEPGEACPSVCSTGAANRPRSPSASLLNPPLCHHCTCTTGVGSV
jgi:hypothetical protein